MPTHAGTQLGSTGAARGGHAASFYYPAHAAAAAAAGTKSTPAPGNAEPPLVGRG